MVEAEPGRVAVVVDTSGSMSAEDLAQCLEELRVIAASRRGVAVEVIPCDSHAHPAQRLRDLRAVQLVGGGGTDLGEGIRAALDLRPAPRAVITRTDGYAPWPSSTPDDAGRTRFLPLLLPSDHGWEPDYPPGWIRTVRKARRHGIAAG
jgi:predicted metal-dependent peptidase